MKGIVGLIADATAEHDADDELADDPLLVLLESDRELADAWSSGSMATIRQVGDLLREIYPDHFSEPLYPPRPTQEQPGTIEKVEVMAARDGLGRFGRQYKIWHPDDPVDAGRCLLVIEGNNRRRMVSSPTQSA